MNREHRRSAMSPRSACVRSRLSRVGVIVGFTVSICNGAFGQSTTTPPTFEVASIKPSQPGSRGWGMTRTPGGVLTMTRMSLHDLITLAYDVRDSQIFGGPGWINSERYDLVAKPEGPATDNQ